MIFNRKYKDSVFTDLFGSDKNGKKNFLDLYNALTGTNYKIEEVKLVNCSDSQTLPLCRTCDILKEYCQFIEIVERTYNRLFPKRSFKRAIEIAMEQGILVDYLDRKSREVINMLSAKYNYKMDIAVKKEEAFQDGVEHKAIETAKKMLADNLDPEKIALYSGLPLEKVLELQKQILVNV